MGSFLEERFPVNVRMGMSYSDDYSVTITQTSGGAEYRQLVQPFPIRSFHVNFTAKQTDLWANVLALYHRAYGKFAGFRVKCVDDFSTNNRTDTPTHLDAILTKVSTDTYQLCSYYGTNSTALAEVGYPKRNIYKVDPGTVKVGVSGVQINNSLLVINNVTGIVTFSAGTTLTITNITRAAQAVITVGSHSLVANFHSVYISGVVGMVQINGQRANIVAKTATTITVAIDSSGYSTYTSGGTAKTNPQDGEQVTAGCIFDIPCRFNSAIEVTALSDVVRDCGSIDLIELVQP